ncbi:Glioma pathoproteinsis- protein 1 [Schistosoma haematobium]|nr:Glioma pathoproteinsis- protein 1 [Schistosoma haematobium]KAH9581374.1 Glioma pathoproteinsis- protein 1 [Schistosoma haematobium]
MWSDNCDVHDKKPTRKVGLFDSVGQNIAVQSELAGAVTYWMKESDHYDHKSDHCEPPHQCDSYKQVCEYTNCVTERTVKLHNQSLNEVSSLNFSQMHLDSSI